MELKKVEVVLLSTALAAAVFSGGFFLGRNERRPVNITLEPVRETVENAAPEADRTHDAPDSALIDINTAPAEDLMLLPGIGEVLAGRILEYREKVGPFGAIEDIKNVEGIGEGTFEKLSGLICVS